MQRTRRAAPMAPAERRAAIVDATIPLVRARGWAVTTRDIATAAGVAEGTIFSVFDNKEAVLIAALDAALDPAPTAARLAQIDLGMPLRDRLVEAVEILQEMMSEMWRLLAAFEVEEVRRRFAQHTTGDFFAGGVLAALFEPSRDELALEPAVAGQALLVLTMTGSQPMLFATPLSSSDIVTLMLDGVRADPERAVAGSARSKR